MKRSDAILQISERLQKNLHRLVSAGGDPKMHCDNIACIVLGEVERMGMTPPSYTHKISTYDGCSTNDIEYYTGKITLHNWEEEE